MDKNINTKKFFRDLINSKEYSELEKLDEELDNTCKKIDNIDSEFKSIINKSTENLTNKRILTKTVFSNWSQEGKWKLGINKNGIGVYYDGIKKSNLSKIENLDYYKAFDWDTFLKEINLNKEKTERLLKIKDAIWKFDKNNIITEKEIENTEIINLNGGINNYLYLSFQNSYYTIKSDWIDIRNIDQKLLKFLIVSQIFNEWKEAFNTHLNALKNKLNHNLEVVKELKEDLDYFLVINEV